EGEDLSPARDRERHPARLPEAVQGRRPQPGREVEAHGVARRADRQPGERARQPPVSAGSVRVCPAGRPRPRAEPYPPGMLATTRHDAVSLLTLQRPDRRNAINLELARAIHEAARAEVEAGARVLVVTGEGTSFCSGADLGGVYGEEFLEALY